MSTLHNDKQHAEVKQENSSQETLLALLQSEKANFLQIAEGFYELQRRTDEHYIQFCRDVIQSIDRVLSAGDWEQSLSLRNAIKPIRELRTRAAEMLARVTGEISAEQYQVEIAEDAELIYVSLFQVHGSDLSQWELQLRSLPRYMIGRPVYKDESHVQTVIRSKVNGDNDAYVVLAVPPGALQQHAVKKTDKHGNELVQLKQGQLLLQHIVEFVHMGCRYHFIDNKLVVKE